uniref:Uncharacterized protein n=1 Tax=Strigamia maritima TaxID=126957 RepID=T1JP30_STRMM
MDDATALTATTDEMKYEVIMRDISFVNFCQKSILPLLDSKNQKPRKAKMKTKRPRNDAPYRSTTRLKPNTTLGNGAPKPMTAQRSGAPKLMGQENDPPKPMSAQGNDTQFVISKSTRGNDPLFVKPMSAHGKDTLLVKPISAQGNDTLLFVKPISIPFMSS